MPSHKRSVMMKFCERTMNHYVVIEISPRNQAHVERLLLQGSLVYYIWNHSKIDPKTHQSLKPLPGALAIQKNLSKSHDLAFAVIESFYESQLKQNEARVLEHFLPKQYSTVTIKKMYLHLLVVYFKIHEVFEKNPHLTKPEHLISCTKSKIYFFLGSLLHQENKRRPLIRFTLRENLLFFSRAFFLGLKFFVPRAFKKKTESNFACTINSETRQFTNEAKKFDVFFQDQRFEPGKIMFFPHEELSEKARLEVLSKGYQYQPKIQYFSLRFLLIYFRGLRQIIKVRKHTLQEVSMDLLSFLSDYLYWKTLLRTHHIKNFLTLADYTTNSLVRNAVFKEKEVKSWFISDSASYFNQWTFRPSGPNSESHAMLTYLIYDHLVTWTEAMGQYLVKCGGQFQKISTVGCIWSQPYRLRSRHSNEPIRIGIFDTSFKKELPVDRDFGKAFFKDLTRLLEDFPQIHLLYKQKYDFSFFQDDPEFIQCIRTFCNHPRVQATASKISTQDIIQDSCFVITCFASSVTLEAIGGGQSGILYEPFENYRNTFMDDVPGLFLHGYNELHYYTQQALDGKKSHLPNQCKIFQHKVAPFTDGKGMERLSSLLLTP